MREQKKRKNKYANMENVGCYKMFVTDFPSHIRGLQHGSSQYLLGK